jgi:hypothetical protein
MLEWGKILADLSVPIAIIVVALLYRNVLGEWLKKAAKISIGPIELERIADASEKILRDTTTLQIVIAEGRILEAEIFLSYPILSDEQTAQMKKNIENLRREIQKLEARSA